MYYSFSLCFFSILFVCASSEEPLIFTDENSSANNALNTFSTKFLSEINKNTTNTIVSPYTIWIALSIINAGAEGKTAAQLGKTLGIPSQNRNYFIDLQHSIVQKIQDFSDGITLDAASSIYPRKEANLNPEFQSFARRFYNVEVTPLDFNNAAYAANYINGQISNITKGRIPQVVEPATVADAEMYIISAMFFKGLWRDSFEPTRRKYPFHNENEVEVGNVPMMYHGGHFPYGVILGGKAEVLQVPYKGERLSMIIVLPKQVPLSSVLSQISQLSFGNMVKTLKITEEVDILMPKFQISSNIDLKATLANMGIRDLFSSTADLRQIAARPLYISAITHKATIEVDEKGTVASASTQSQALPISADYNIKFTVERPFAIFLYDNKTESILFAGTVYKPKYVGKVI